MKANEFDDTFDSGENIIGELDLNKSRRPGLKSKLVNVDFPEWTMNVLDQESKKAGITRRWISKVWIAQKLKESNQL